MAFVKELSFNDDARGKILSGVHKLFMAVSSTLGASGKTVILEDESGTPVITKDGVTVANSVVLRDPVENIGATLLKDAARKTVEEAGDGTTTSTVLAHSILMEASAAQDSGNTSTLIKEMRDSSNEVIKYLESIAKPVKGDMLNHVATISVNNDKELGKIISDAFNEVGENGVVRMETSMNEKTEYSIINGATLDKGLKNLHFATNEEKTKAVMNNPVILIVEDKINSIRKIETVLEYVIKNKKELLIIGEAEDQVTSALAMNKIRGNIKVNIIDSPNYGFNRKEKLQDLAMLTGAKVISEDLGDDMDLIKPEYLGTCVKSITTSDETIIEVESLGEDVLEAIKAVKKQIKEASGPGRKATLERRLAFLSCKVGVVKVGASSDVELKEKKDRVEDAIYAVRAAIKEGVVPGGGIALLNAAHHVVRKTDGAKVLTSAIEAPWRTILENAGITSDEMDARDGYGLDVSSNENVDMISHGVIDPLLVTKSALKNAVSVATTILSTNCVINNIRVDEGS